MAFNCRKWPLKQQSDSMVSVYQLCSLSATLHHMS